MLQTLLTQVISLLLQGRFLDLQLHNLTPELIQLRRHGIQLRLNQSAGFIHQVNGLIRQETVGDITVGEGSGSYEGGVRDFHTVKYLITLFQTTQDRNGIFHRRLIHHNRLETTLQRRILLNVLTVLIQSGRADAVQLATGQHRLQHIAGIHSSVGLACAHNQVQLIDEEDDLALALPNLLQNGFQTLLKLAAVLGTGHQRAHIQGKYLLVLQTLRYIAPHDTLCQTLHNGGLADAGFTD